MKISQSFCTTTPLKNVLLQFSFISFPIYVLPQVEPFASLASRTRPGVPRLLLNRELVGPFKQHRRRPSDHAITGDLVDSVRELARAIGWDGLLSQLQAGPMRQDRLPQGRKLEVFLPDME